LQNTVLLDAEGRVILADHKFIAKFSENYNIALEPGRLFIECLTTDELRDDFRKHFAEVKRGKAILRYETQFATGPNQHLLWYDVTYSPVLGPNQELVAVVIAQLDITKRKEDEERLLKMNEVLVTQNTRLNHYSYVVSHNLRAPVASLLGLINLMELQGLVNTDNREVVGFIRDSALGMDTVIRDLNRILSETRAMEEQKAQVDFAHETEMVKSLLAMEIQRNHVVIEADFAAVPGVSTIKSFLSSIFLNLISNAIKYHKPGRQPVITLTSRTVPESPQFCCLTFADNGLGIDLANQGDHLFKLYRRFHDHVDGKGMGLYLVKTQVEMLGGKIEVESQVDQGTRFHIYLKEK
jgi:signal transduction histidine kinase